MSAGDLPRRGAIPPGIERVVMVVFDGLRPALVRADTTPNLHRFAQQGASFTQAHSVFPSVTRVCTSSIATGAPPAVHGIVGNAFFHPGVEPQRPLDLATIEDFRRFAQAGEPALTAPTFADVLAAGPRGAPPTSRAARAAPSWRRPRDGRGRR